MLVDGRAEWTRSRIRTVDRLHWSEPTPGDAREDMTTLQAKAILVWARPKDLAGKTRRRPWPPSSWPP
jgi:hypothetical protein